MGVVGEWFVVVVKCKEWIVVFGDYDVDGGSLIVLLVDWLCQMGLWVIIYIFDCIDEGYGFNEQVMVDFVCDYDLIICVDCGMLFYGLIVVV